MTTTTDDDRLDGIEYWRAVAGHEDDVVLDERIDAALAAEWTPLVELDAHTEARGGVVHLAGATDHADAVDAACEAARAGAPLHVHAVATPITQDQHAVSIFAEPAGRGDVPATRLGYLPREIARLVHDGVRRDELVVLPVVYLARNGRAGRPGMRLVVARRAGPADWAFSDAALEAVGRIRRRPTNASPLPRHPGTTAFEHWLGDHPEDVIARAVQHLATRNVRIVPEIGEAEPGAGAPVELPPTWLFPYLERLVDGYSDQELVAAAAAWGIHPDLMARSLESALRSSGSGASEEPGLGALAVDTAERWRQRVALRLVAIDA